jgi:uncharacterized phage-associated protein
MTTINDVADFFLQKAQESGSLVTNLKLQKLCYYAQAWHLALHEDHPLFEEEFEAWVHGPVCRDLYNRFRSYQWRPILEEVRARPLEATVTNHLQMIVENFFPCDAYELERMTHEELPWKQARQALAEDQPCDRVISKSVMGAFYREMLKNDSST